MSRSRVESGDRTSGPSFKLVLPALLLISFAVLTFEVALTRVFSVILSYHFVFAVVSSAMFGLGIGGVIFRRWGPRLPGRSIWVGTMALSLSLAVSLLLILVIPVGGSGAVSGLRLALYLILAVVPFGAAGTVVSGLFQTFSDRSSLLYGADLVGAAGGALVVVPAMNLIGPVNLVLLTAVVAAAAAILLGLPRFAQILPAVAAAVIIVGAAVVLIAGGIDITVPITTDPNKDMASALSDPNEQFRILESRWSSFGRTDLLESPLYPNQKYLFVDGAAGSPMYDLNAVLGNPQVQADLMMHSGEFFPFEFLKDDQKRTALILGSGGGQEVVTAILGGVKLITAVEVNPDVVKIVQEYKDYSGAIYSGRPGITAVVAEGRNYVRSSLKKFDLIMASIPITKSSRSVEGFALTENNLFTVEALGDYLDHLTDNGRIIIVAHSDHEIYRLVGLALGAFGRRGVSETEAMNHLYTVPSEMMPTLVVQEQPLTQSDAEAIHAKIHGHGREGSALFIPHIQQQYATLGPNYPGPPISMLDRRLVEIAQGMPSATAFSQNTDLDLSPTTDDRPFFYDDYPGLPSPFPVFLGLLIASLVGVGTLLILPRNHNKSPSSFIGTLRAGNRLKTYLALFFLLGLGYMVVEISLFQKLSLYISQPQMSLTVLLFSLLLGGGIGSLLTGLLKRNRLRTAAMLAVVAAIVVVALSMVFPRAFSFGMSPRLTAITLILPLGIVMGCSFPLIMKSLGAEALGDHTAVLWGVNGAASVLGSALAMIIGISWGFSRALFLGAAIYVLVAVGLLLLARTAIRNPKLAET
ncbi:MAG: hypothetical protein M1274_01290 [Actinobacteria bacterium]|nr:hypothetical protein [Actinomycetota bacterium]